MKVKDVMKALKTFDQEIEIGFYLKGNYHYIETLETRQTTYIETHDENGDAKPTTIKSDDKELRVELA